MSSFAAGTPQHSTLWLVVRCSRRATRRRCGHRHAGAVRRTSVSLAFCCPRTCVRGQHLIVPPTNAATAAARMQPQTCTKNSTNPSHLSSKQTPHISHSPAYKNTNPSHFPPAPAPPPLQPSPSIYIYTNPSHFTLPDSPLTPHCPDSPSLGPPLPAPGSRLPAHGSRLPAPGARLPAPGTRLPAPGSRLPAPGPIPALAPRPNAARTARIHHHHKPQLPCPHCIFVSTSARARSCPVLAASHPRQRLPRASIHPAPACAGKRREERDLLCRISDA
jgi:hypothetical protein